MLFPNDELDLDKIDYPILCTVKYDGVRLIFKDGRMYNRSMKLVPNEKLQDYFHELRDISLDKKIILDGEFFIPGLLCSDITSYVTSYSKEIPKEAYVVLFDIVSNARYTDRLDILRRLQLPINAKVINTVQANSKEKVQELFEQELNRGAEGLVLRSLYGKYKFGRVTIKEGNAYKMKPYMTFDAKVIGFTERFENLNESFKNELGHSTKRNTKDAKKGTGILGVFTVQLGDSVQEVTATGTEEFRREIWENQSKYLGKMLEFKGMAYGKKDKIRHPTFLRWRTDKDEV